MGFAMKGFGGPRGLCRRAWSSVHDCRPSAKSPSPAEALPKPFRLMRDHGRTLSRFVPRGE